MKKILKSLLASILVIAMVVPNITVFAATSVPYKKTDVVYTVSGNKYYQAQTTSDYNGVSAGTEFWLDSSSNIVTDASILTKLLVLKNIGTENFFSLIESAMESTSEAAHGYYDVFTSISAVNKMGTIVGNFSGRAISLMTNTAYGFTDIAIDVGSEALSTDNIKTVALISMLKIYANNCDAKLNEVENLKKSASTNYDSLISLIDCFAESQACLTAIIYLAGDDIEEYVNSSLWNKLLNYFKDVLGGIADAVIPDIWAVEIFDALADGTMNVIPLTELALSTNVDKVFSQKKQEVYDSYIMVLNKNVSSSAKSIADKLAKNTSSTPSPSVSNNTVGSMTSSSSKSTYTTDENVVITWTQASNATRYGLTIVNNATNEKVVNASNFTGTSYTVGKLPAGTYRFNMCGYNSNGSAGPVSAIKEFTVKEANTSTSSYSTGTYKPSEWDGLNMRSGASTSNSIVGAIASGTSFVVTKVSGNWGYTTCNGKSGWVCLDYATPISSSDNTQNPTDTSGNMDIEVFIQKLNQFKKRYPHGSKYIDNPSKTGGYECFGFANELGVDIFGSYPTNSMSANGVNNNWTVTYGGNAIDSLCIGDIVRYHNHSIFITEIVGDTIYYCEALGDLNNKVQWEQSISRKTLKQYVSEKLTSNNTNKTGWVAHYKNGLSHESIPDSNTKTPEANTPEYETITEGTYVLNCIIQSYRYLTAKTDSNGGQVEAKPFENIDAQKFDIAKSGNGYKIVSKNSSTGRVVSGYNDGVGQTTGNVTLANSSSSSSQIWLFRKEGDCYVIYPSFNTSLALTSASTGRVVVSTYTGNDDQLWNLSLQNAESEKYTVTYNANGGSGAPSSQTKTHGESIKVSSQEPTRSGYEFEGWATSADGDVDYDPSESYTKDSDITFYAVWKPLSYKVTYNANGGTGAPAAQVKIHNEKLYITDDTPERDGYSFVGWATTKTGSVSYKASQQYTSDKDITLYAVWEANTYTISYNANGGSGVPKNQTKKYAESIKLSTQEPTRKDYIFLGWSTSAKGSVEFAPGSVCSVNENITLYALWQEEENEVYYIIYNANGGKNAPSMQTKNEDEDITISEVVPTREGYTFDGWAIGNNDTVVYSSGDTYKENKTLYLHAVWTANTYTISYDANGGFDAPRNQTKIHDEDIVLSTMEPEKEDCVFIGWSDDPYAEHAKYYTEDTFSENSDTVLYAVWEEIIEEDEDDEEADDDKDQSQKEIPFEDVPEDAWYRKDVENAYKNGLINGKSEKRYAPGDNMTYAEAIKLACTIYQLYYDGEVTLTNGSDVWYSTYMDYALENRIVRTDYSSVANEYVTRKEFVNIFYGALPLKEFAKINNVEDNIIPDVKICDAYSGEIYTFYRAGILTGNDAKGTFKPDSNISRSEVAAIVIRMLDSGARKEIYIK